MNERIKELKQKAYVIKDGEFCFDDGKVEILDINKLVELIVQECITVVQNTPRHCAYTTTFQESIVDCTIDLSVQSIEQHFSIKGIK
jgi:hypothetical protein